jgi:hypothetical protein
MALWERQEGESTPAYNAFWAYCTIPSNKKRTYAAVAERVGKSDSLIRRWAKQWNWERRTIAYDNFLVQEEFEELKKERLKSAKKHIAIARSFQAQIVQRLKKLAPEELTPGDLIKWFDTTVKIERQALGESTESITHELTGRDGNPVEIKSDINLSKYSEEELMFLAGFIAKGRAGTGDNDEEASGAGRN